MIWARLAGLFGSFALSGAVLGSLLAGLATPTEAAGVGATIVRGATLGEATPARFRGALLPTARSFAVIAMVFAGVLILAQAIALLGLPQQIPQAIAEAGLSRWVLLAFVVLLYLALGLFSDGLSMMIMTLPLVFPLLTGVGSDPLQAGMIVTIMIETGMLTPPVGMKLFVLVGVTRGEVPLAEAGRGPLPCWLCLPAEVGLLAVMPGLATWLPAIAYD